MRLPICLSMILITISLSAQEFTVDGEITATSVLSNDDQIPFWMYSNVNGSLGSESNFSGTGAAKATYQFSDSFIEVGAAFFYRDNLTDEFQRKDLYAKYQNNWLAVTAGAKSQQEKLNGLSSSNKNFLLSTNARPLPGMIIEANNPLKISNSLGIDWGIAHYFLNDDRVVSNPYVHYKRLGLHWKINEHHLVKGTIQHFAQWGGTSPTYGDLPEDLKEYVDVFIAKKTGDRVNAPGNHLGSYLFEYDTKTKIGDFSFYHEHPFEDGSGTRFANFPDGIWGIFFSPQSKNMITSVLYEFIDTTNQSFTQDGAGADSYFNHRIYASGWTYDGNTLGIPFITPPINNRVRAHQFGATSTIWKIAVLAKVSFVQSNGTIYVPFEVEQNNMYSFLKATYSIEKYGRLSLLFGYDTNSLSDDIIGGGFSYQYNF